MSALLFGSISTVADTSELQRAAFNEAFEAEGLDWTWSREDYRSMLAANGGQSRISDYASSRGESVDAEAIHAHKSALFEQRLANTQITARPGVLDTIEAAKANGWKLGLVTTTSAANVSALLDSLSSQLRREDFDVIVDRADVEKPKPDRAAYDVALRALDESSAHCVAIEDNVGGLASASAAGVTCVAFPNENTATHDFSAATLLVDHEGPLVFDKLIDHH